MALTRPRYSNFVDNDFKNSCRVVTTTNITLTGGAPSSYDGVSLAISDRILVAGQSTASQNGIYIVGTLGTGSNGTWIRSFDANDGTKLSAGAQVPIAEGTYGGRTWRMTTPDPITIGSTNLTFLDGAAIAGGSSTQLQFNNSGSLQGISTLTYVSGNTSVVSTGNVFAAAIYTDNLRWAANSAAIALTGNINPAVYIGNTAIGTATVLIDSVPSSGNTMVSWTTMSRDVPNARYKKSTIDSFNDGSTVTFSESAIKSDPGYPVATFSSNISGGLINLWATGDSSTVVVTFERRLLGTSTPTGYINNYGPQGLPGTISLTSGNIVTTATSAATSTTTGALQIAGGAGIAGALYTGGNIVAGLDLTVLGNLTVLGTTTTLNTNTLDVEDLNITVAKGALNAASADGAGITVDGAAATFNYTASTDAWTSNKKIYATTFYTGTDLKWSGNGAVFRSGINYTTSDTAPINSNYGDQWYDTTTDILYEWQTANGINGFWVDIGSLAIIANANLSNQTFNTVSANNITSTGNVTASNVVLGGIGSGYVYANNFIFSQNGASIFDSFGVNSYGNVNVGQYLPKHTGNLQAANVYVVGNESISNYTGALRVIGGVGVTGGLNLYQPTATGYFANISGYGRPGSGVQTWQFYINSSIGGPDSWMNFPDGTNQYTAYPGTSTSLSTFDTNISNLVTQANANTAAYLTTYTGNVSAGYLALSGNAIIGNGLGNYLQIYGNNSPGSPSIIPQGVDSSISLNLYSKGISGVVGIYTNSVKQFDVYGPASSVNYVRASGAIAGAAPYIQAQGSATNVDLAVSAKNDGNLVFTGGNVVTSLTGNINLSANLRVYSSASSTSSTTGGLIVQGGIGVTGSINASGNISAGNVNVSKTTITYQPASTTGTAMVISAADTKGGAGYNDFLQVINTSSGASNINKWFRVNITGELQIINNAYTSQLMVLSDAGDLSIAGNVSQTGIKPFYSANRPGFRVYGSTVTSWNTATNGATNYFNSNQYTVDYNTGSYLNTTTGVFTAPVAGLYQVNLNARYAGNTTVISQAVIVKNATSGNGSGGTISLMLEFAQNSTMNHAGVGTTLQLAVNDTLVLKVTAGTIQFDSNDSWSVAYLG